MLSRWSTHIQLDRIQFQGLLPLDELSGLQSIIYALQVIYPNSVLICRPLQRTNSRISTSKSLEEDPLWAFTKNNFKDIWLQIALSVVQSIKYALEAFYSYGRSFQDLQSIKKFLRKILCAPSQRIISRTSAPI